MVAKEAFALLGYATCSSLMLVMNKVAVHVLPAPSFVLLMQFLASWLAVKVCGLCGCIVVDGLELTKLRQFFFVSLRLFTLRTAMSYSAPSTSTVASGGAIFASQ